MPIYGKEFTCAEEHTLNVNYTIICDGIKKGFQINENLCLHVNMCFMYSKIKGFKEMFVLWKPDTYFGE